MRENSKRVLELGVELLETGALVAQILLKVADENGLDFPERKALGNLLVRAASIMNEIREPYKGRLPFASDESLHDDESDADYTEPKITTRI